MTHPRTDWYAVAFWTTCVLMYAAIILWWAA